MLWLVLLNIRLAFIALANRLAYQLSAPWLKDSQSRHT